DRAKDGRVELNLHEMSRILEIPLTQETSLWALQRKGYINRLSPWSEKNPYGKTVYEVFENPGIPEWASGDGLLPLKDVIGYEPSAIELDARGAPPEKPEFIKQARRWRDALRDELRRLDAILAEYEVEE